MSLIRSKNTNPEMIVRKLAFSLGLRYRLHKRTLPGSPDLVFARHRKVVFVHGCFWHRHTCKYGKPRPKTRKAFWAKKFESNIQRDEKNLKELKKLKWKALVLWECQTRKPETVLKKLERFFSV